MEAPFDGLLNNVIKLFTPTPPPRPEKKMHSVVFAFSVDDFYNTQGRLETMVMENFGDK